MQRILVLNPKGGSGKTTVATNLASYFASQGDHPLLTDNDPQGSSTRWLNKRKPEPPFIHGIADLLLIAKGPREESRIGVIANRVKRNTLVYRSVMRFLETLRIPVIATL